MRRTAQILKFKELTAPDDFSAAIKALIDVYPNKP